MKTGRSILLLIVRLGLVIGASAFAFHFCGWIILAYQPNREWEQLPSPVDPAVEILMANAWTHEILVRTEMNSFFLCSLFDEQCLALETEAALLEAKNLSPPPDCFGELREEPPAIEGTIVDSMEVRFCGADSSTQGNYAVLSDESIWEWRYTWDWGPAFAAAIASRVGAIVTAFIGILLLIWHYSRT